MTFQEFVQAAQTIAGEAATINVEVDVWIGKHYNGRPSFKVWDADLNHSYIGDRPEVALAAYAAAKAAQKRGRPVSTVESVGEMPEPAPKPELAPEAPVA